MVLETKQKMAKNRYHSGLEAGLLVCFQNKACSISACKNTNITADDDSGKESSIVARMRMI